MKLTELHPEYGALDSKTDGTGRFFLSFDCPTTPGGRVYVMFHQAPEVFGVWQCLSPWTVIEGLEHLGPRPDITTLTLKPSIGSHVCKKRVRCSGHVSILHGEVLG